MDIDSDVLVIGGGMAGLVIGIFTAEAGLDTIVLRKGQSATALSSGAIDFIGYMPDGKMHFTSPVEGMLAISSLYPLHPYAIVGYDEETMSRKPLNLIDRAGNALTWLMTKLSNSMASLTGNLEGNFQPITTIGTTKPTCLLQETMDYGNLYDDDENVLMFVGIKGLAEFNAFSAAKTFRDYQVDADSPPRKVLHSIIEVQPFGKSYNIAPIEIARHLDHEGSMDSFIQQLGSKIAGAGVTHLALPPVLGIKNALTNKARIDDSLSVQSFELLSFPPSIPGLRLQTSLENQLRKSGGRLLVGHEASKGIIENTRVTKVFAQSPRREIEIKPKSVALATGMYISGGLTATETGFKESVFDLQPVSSKFFSASDEMPRRHTSIYAISPGGHDIFGFGLGVDPEFKPIGLDGVEVAENLFAAGSILAGYNYTTEKSGLGVSLLTGHRVGRNIVETIREGA